MAVGRAFGPGTGLDLGEQLVATGKFETYHLLPSVRGDLLLQLGLDEEARDEFRRAATMTRNECAGSPPAPGGRYLTE